MSAQPLQTIEFNVGGRYFEVSRSLLVERLPADSVLRRLIAEKDGHEDDPDPRTIFIDNDGDVFGQVLNYLRNNRKIVLPVTIPKEMFLRNLDHYGISYDDDDVQRKILTSSFGQDEVDAEADNAKFPWAKGRSDEMREENSVLREQVRALTAIEVTGPGHDPVYARGQLGRDGRLTSLGPKGDYWTESLRHERHFPLNLLGALEVWIGGSLRGGSADVHFRTLAWSRLGQRLPLLFVCSRPGNVVLAVNFGWTEEELVNSLVDIDQFTEARDDVLIQFICEDLAQEDPSRACQFVAVSLPKAQNRMLGQPFLVSGEQPVPKSIFIEGGL